MIFFQAEKIARSHSLKSENGISPWKASTGWYSRFKIRNNVSDIRLFGEAGDVDLCEPEMEMVKCMIALEKFDLDCIFNMDCKEVSSTLLLFYDSFCINLQETNIIACEANWYFDERGKRWGKN